MLKQARPQQPQQQQQQQQQLPSKICRVCLALVDECVEINTVEQSSGFMPYRDKLALVVPEMMLDMIQDPVICIPCSNGLKQAYEFKQKCMQTEGKIRRLVQNCGGVIYSLDLTNIADRSKTEIKQPPPLAPLVKPIIMKRSIPFPPTIILKVDKKKQQQQQQMRKQVKIPEHQLIRKQVKIPLKEQERMRKTQVDIQIPEVVTVEDSGEEAEIEFHAVNELAEKNALELEEEPLLVPTTEEPIEIQDDPLFDPNDVESTEDKMRKMQRISCNFCGQSFFGMFCLRNHQRLCAGAMANIEEIKAETEKRFPIPVPNAYLKRKRKRRLVPFKEEEDLSKKSSGTRITLPERAKNVLQMWLFKHRDNPYPTDVDKLELIKQTNLTLVQVENWFINARRRILQKMLTRDSKYEQKLNKVSQDRSDDDSSQLSC